MKKDNDNKKKKPRFCLITAIIIILIFIALLIIGWYLLSNLGFWSDVTFENKSGEEIKITPIGIVEGRNEIGPIIRMKKEWLFFEPPNKRINLDSGKSIKITYDTDDQNLQFLVIEYPRDDIRILKIDAEFWENKTYKGGYYVTREDRYIIPPKDELPICPEILKPTIKGKYVKVTDELINIFMEL